MWEVKVYIEGKGVTKDLPKAKSLFQKGCDLDAGLACRMLGTMYQKGNSVTQDLSKAEALYQKCNEPTWHIKSKMNPRWQLTQL